MLEMLVAAALGTIVLVGASRMIQLSSDSARRADVKSEAINLEKRVQNLLGDADACKALLLDPMPPAHRIFDGRDPAAFNNDTVKSSVSLRLPDGSMLGAGSKSGAYKIGTLRLRVVGQIPPAGSSKFEGMLVFGGDSAQGGRQLAGGEIRNRELPLVLVTEAVNPSDDASKLRRIVGCQMKLLSGKEICESIGGRFIEEINRCYFGGDLKLERDQCLSSANFERGGPLYGAKVTTCYYRYGYASARMSEYRCFNFPHPSYAKCVCRQTDTAAQSGWQIYRQADNRFFRPCEGGVLIQGGEGATFLSSNEIVEERHIEPSQKLTVADLDQADGMLDAVQECYFEDLLQSMRAFRCNQGDKARLGAAGSCVFVNGTNAFDVGGWRNYTGWIYVLYPRSLLLRGPASAYSQDVLEARGRKCHAVKILPSAASNAATRITSDSDSLAVLADPMKATQVKECLFLGGPPSLQATTGQPNPVTSGVPRGAYVQRYPCSNESLDLMNLTGDGPTATAPSLSAGHCWYFRKVQLLNGFKGNWLGGSNTTGGTYTGWVYLRARITDGHYDTVVPYDLSGTTGTAAADTGVVERQKVGAAYKNVFLNGVPCNLGVRLGDTSMPSAPPGSP